MYIYAYRHIYIHVAYMPKEKGLNRVALTIRCSLSKLRLRCKDAVRTLRGYHKQIFDSTAIPTSSRIENLTWALAASPALRPLAPCGVVFG